MARLSVLAVFAVAVLAAAGCGGSGDGTASSDSSGADEAAAGTAAGERNSAAGTERELVANREAARRRAAQRRRRARRGKPLRVVNSQFGRVVADGRGEALYLFDKEKGRRSQCYGACARAWPPVLTRARPRALRGINPRLLGVTRRRDGTFQVTYRNHPLYYYVHDRPGLILCQDVFEYGGLWLVVKPNGTPVT